MHFYGKWPKQFRNKLYTRRHLLVTSSRILSTKPGVFSPVTKYEKMKSFCIQRKVLLKARKFSFWLWYFVGFIQPQNLIFNIGLVWRVDEKMNDAFVCVHFACIGKIQRLAKMWVQKCVTLSQSRLKSPKVLLTCNIAINSFGKSQVFFKYNY